MFSVDADRLYHAQIPGTSERTAKLGSVIEALTDIQSQVQSTWEVEHNLDGTHGALSCDSLAVRGDETVGGDLAVDGAATAASLVLSDTPLDVPSGGTGKSLLLPVGALMYAGDGGDDIVMLATPDGATARVLVNGGTEGSATAPSWAQIPLTAAVGLVTGDLPFANIEQIATARVLGRSTAGTGDIEVLATLPAVSGANLTSLNASNISSGTLALARGGSNADLSATGGSNQVVQQASAGGAFTVGQLSSSNLSDSSNLAKKNADNSFSADQTVSKTSPRYNLTNTGGGGEKIITIAADTQTGFQLSKDSTPSTAIWWGLSNPGGADGNYHVWSTYNGSAFTQRMQLDDVGNLKLAGTATRATTEGTNHVDIFDGTAPAGTLANGVSLYSTSGELRVMDAAGNPTLLSPHDKEGFWIFESRSGLTGEMFTVDMEKMIRKLNDMLGGGFVHDHTSK